ncbi:hypothetical protein C500_11170 [Natrialba magadii ATCC 43099]|uniref:Uncharacterized protein n=1 Tax=Natrialba magadii (strain ATCC 43099 / DSM 3394 / CCM 3739 / CIP 104546 / IAM 13178 / JCM 8861 / NBRC 102185 / NCIMB 2190 / MS3) TaxID=547559 RepID=L9UWN1_NATMM|nr:hypothetical protein C500_11170 [Natrialba magadii ATCC 43099]
MKTDNSHGDSLKQLFDGVSVAVVEVTAQVVTTEGSQVATSIDENLFANIVFLGKLMQKRRRRIGPAAAVHIDLE